MKKCITLFLCLNSFISINAQKSTVKDSIAHEFKQLILSSADDFFNSIGKKTSEDGDNIYYECSKKLKWANILLFRDKKDPTSLTYAATFDSKRWDYANGTILVAITEEIEAINKNGFLIKNEITKGNALLKSLVTKSGAVASVLKIDPVEKTIQLYVFNQWF
ncbi:MAG: hypothetical protein FD136_202 [Chitinophagaceae bacterium]|nr:MAG: hypothetical protein FD136_202 [Chitinophagaceae bacterium]